jgi:uncharacterized protein YecE (DUF72 family)
LEEYLIGTGGWTYFRVPGLKSLIAYSRIFNFVEVNSTFYQIPDPKMVEEWKRLVPADFKFAVRAHNAIAHKYELQPVEEAIELLEKMRRISETLKADILHVQTPLSLKLNDHVVEGFRQLLSSSRLDKVRLALELRENLPHGPSLHLLKVMQDNGVIHCVDLSRGEKPAYDSDILYTRLFGRGHHNIYQPTDEELEEIDHTATDSKSEKVVMSFHFVRMYKDAARMKIYKQTGKFPKITRSTGLDSLEEVLKENTVFPATKQDLIERQGWKLFDETETKRVHLAEYLDGLPDRMYENLRQVTDKLGSTMRS